MPKGIGFNRGIGKRIGAVLGKEGNTLHLLGYGVYSGDEVPPEGIRWSDCPNPKLTLDNGDVVWGCQCWWGTEAGVKAHVDAFDGKVVVVRMADVLAEEEAKKVGDANGSTN